MHLSSEVKPSTSEVQTLPFEVGRGTSEVPPAGAYLQSVSWQKDRKYLNKSRLYPFHCTSFFCNKKTPILIGTIAV